MESKRNEEKLREKLYFDERTKTIPKSTIKNRVIEEIVSEGDVFVGNKQLLGSVFKLKTLNLLKQNETNINRYAPGSTIFPFVFNDYHSKSTNNGYSRQEKGGFFFTRWLVETKNTYFLFHLYCKIAFNVAFFLLLT